MFRLKYFAYRVLPDVVVRRLRAMRFASMFKDSMINRESDAKAVVLFVSKGDHVIDLGANFGLYTKYLSELVGASGHVYSFEPIPVTFASLQRNVSHHMLKNVSLFPIAVSSKDGAGVLQVPRFETGGESYYEAHIVSAADAQPDLRTIEVPMTCLDTWSADHPARITFIKCDVEGHELECIQGATTLIERYKPTWLIEIKGDPDDAGLQAGKTFDVMRGFGYQVYIYVNDELRLRQPGEQALNYFFSVHDNLS
jgi:FkbM family methyltransferase